MYINNFQFDSGFTTVTCRRLLGIFGTRSTVAAVAPAARRRAKCSTMVGRRWALPRWSMTLRFFEPRVGGGWWSKTRKRRLFWMRKYGKMMEIVEKSWKHQPNETRWPNEAQSFLALHFWGTGFRGIRAFWETPVVIGRECCGDATYGMNSATATFWPRAKSQCTHDVSARFSVIPN